MSKQAISVSKASEKLTCQHVVPAARFAMSPYNSDVEYSVSESVSSTVWRSSPQSPDRAEGLPRPWVITSSQRCAAVGCEDSSAVRTRGHSFLKRRTASAASAIGPVGAMAGDAERGGVVRGGVLGAGRTEGLGVGVGRGGEVGRGATLGAGDGRGATLGAGGDPHATSKMVPVQVSPAALIRRDYPMFLGLLVQRGNPAE